MPVRRHMVDDPSRSDRLSIKLLTDDPGCPVLLKCDRSAVLSVHVIGHSAPLSVRWFVGQRRVRDCPRYGLSTDGHELYALVIRQVTEELECGVLVTASSDNGVSSKLIDVKTYRVLTRTDHKPDVRTGTIGSLRQRRQVRGQLMSYPVRGRQSLGSLCALRPSSIQGLTVRKAYSSTDAILKKGRMTPETADSSSLPDKRKPSGAIRMRSGVRAVEARRLKKAFSWVENSVQELPTPPITPGVWEAGRPVYLSQDCLLTPSTPVRVSSPPSGYVVGRSSSTQSRSSTDTEDLENEVLWEMYGFKLGRERPLPGVEEQPEEPQRDPRPLEKQKERHENGNNPLKIHSQPNFIAEAPSSAVHLEKLNRGEKARSVPGLELTTRGSRPGYGKQRSDPRYLFLRTNARTICLENPVIADMRRPNDSEKRFSLPQDFYAEQFKWNPAMEGNQSDVYKSYEGVNHREPGSLQVKTFNGTHSPHKPRPTTGLVETFGSQAHCRNQMPLDKSRHALAKSCDEFFVGQPSYASDHKQELSKQQQQPKQQHSASYKRKAFSATVNYRKKNAAGSTKEGDRITKFILVDIDFDNKSEKPGLRSEWSNVERGRSRATGEGHQDERRVVSRSRSADSSYLYETMYRGGQMKSGRQSSTEGLLLTNGKT